ncbi:helix-turn-helix domain-containing protein [Proteiniphilum saccharofermentans]|uniref:helix-turn-helix domain-containing protein n=1 Tax=Proteiniphilum saccharofermentans TaxID=1642647 RepID=UPI0028A829C7|nr:helix-turn-helix domain-containing protein [Proteiniphilum saccharofermentans]
MFGLTVDSVGFQTISLYNTGYAPLQFFHELKLKRAKKLLTETSKPLKEIADELGFGTYDYFLSFFEKRTGQSPSNYRK